MSRNRQSAKQAGARFERVIADHLAEVWDDRIDRRVKTGATDKGDIVNFRYQGDRVVIECKDYGGKIHAAQWVREAATEAENDNARAGLAVVKRRGVTDPDKQYVLMELGQLLALLGGRHDD
ncbi:hypothetical protein [uncultured Corynebacterium sp.]|uniref:putative PDDEXK endonuclease n=1 Tax=uncultured Corynebacterium sp. TaxID=159447 RepID=UPI0025E50EE5|nr:hypothetical protein [uncultured Corynebacterium sp.]